MSIDIVRGPGETVWINGKQVWPMPALANRTPEQPAPKRSLSEVCEELCPGVRKRNWPAWAGPYHDEEKLLMEPKMTQDEDDEQPAPRKHRWGGCKLGGSPVEESSQEWVRYCEDCGMEDTCEDPLPPCPGPEQPAPKQAGDVVERMLEAFHASSTGNQMYGSSWNRTQAMTAALAEARRGMVTMEQVEKAIRGTFGRSSWVIGEGRELAELVLAELAPKQDGDVVERIAKSLCAGRNPTATWETIVNESIKNDYRKDAQIALAEATRGMVTLAEVEKALRKMLHVDLCTPQIEAILARLTPKQGQKEEK